MRRLTYAFTAAVILSFSIVPASTGALAQSTPTAPSSSTGPTPAAAPTLVAKEIEGLDVFGSDGQQLGKVVKVNLVADGKVKDVEVQSRGFLGFFSKTYVVPAEKLNKKGGRMELSITSEQAKQFAK